MSDKEIYDWIKRALDHITGYIEAVDKRLNSLVKVVAECRKHCDQCRDTCAVRDDHEGRIRTLERQAIGSNKGAKLIATCAIVSGLMGVAGNLIARLF